MRTYPYVGPAEHLARASVATAGRPVTTAHALAVWLSEQPPDDVAEPFTYTVDTGLLLRLAPRRSEHVVCSGGVPVIAAGEMSFTRQGGNWEVDGVTNQSTGYCPDPESWAAVHAALETAGVEHPAYFTHAFTFRRCAGCGHQNIVRDEYFFCALCDEPLPP
ncbi:hypothetical protein EBN88_07435 [Streptomyces triticirhizae]|uniref:Uncharacterized protein n=1 Tax=Streptomyces triticirhizae TaxID=2483353 RepID=A0A3M2M150_9ACTN|nr:hypothetical protein EBN88_07435 [Streptomyces triticirhizae]